MEKLKEYSNTYHKLAALDDGVDQVVFQFFIESLALDLGDKAGLVDVVIGVILKYTQLQWVIELS